MLQINHHIIRQYHVREEDKALEEGEEYKFIPIEPVEHNDDGGPQPHSTPKKKAEPVASVLAEQFKQLDSQDLQQILFAIQTEKRNRQDVTISPAHGVLHSVDFIKGCSPQNKHPQIICFQWGKG